MHKNAWPSENSQAPVGLLNLQEAADFLGISIRKVHEITASKKLRIVKIGRSVRVRPQDLEQFIEANLVG